MRFIENLFFFFSNLEHCGTKVFRSVVWVANNFSLALSLMIILEVLQIVTGSIANVLPYYWNVL